MYNIYTIIQGRLVCMFYQNKLKSFLLKQVEYYFSAPFPYWLRANTEALCLDSHPKCYI